MKIEEYLAVAKNIGLTDEKTEVLRSYMEMMQQQQIDPRGVQQAMNDPNWAKALQQAASTSSVPKPPTYADFLKKFDGDEKSMWMSYWSGFMDPADRQVFEQKCYSADRAMQHLIVPLIGQIIARLDDITERLDKQDKQDEQDGTADES